MYYDVFEDNRECSVENKKYAHGSESCDDKGYNCNICINGRWVDKVRNRGSLYPD